MFKRTILALAASAALFAIGAAAKPQRAPAHHGEADKAQPGGVPADKQAALASLAAEHGVPVDSFRQPEDPDDTLAFARAAEKGVPILLQERTYKVQDFATGRIPRFVLRGVPGRSLIQRAGASGAGFFQINAAEVLVEGVTFDMNKDVVKADQWGVLLNRGGQTVVLRGNVFRNNSGKLGSCVAIANPARNGAVAGGAFTFEDNEVTGCAFNAAYFASVSDGRIAGNRIHDTQGSYGLYISGYGAASAENHSSNIVVDGNRIWNNKNGLGVGGIAAPYDFTRNNWGARSIRVSGNEFWDNSTAQINNQGYDVQIVGNTLRQAEAAEIRFGVLCNSVNMLFDGNRMDHRSTDYSIDCGGALNPVLTNNRISAARGSTLNIGGTQGAVVRGNTVKVSGTAFVAIVYATEGGSGGAFQTTHSNMLIENNEFDIVGKNARGIAIFDNAGGFPGAKPSLIRNNDFNFSDGASAVYGLSWRAAGNALVVQGNRLNGSTRCYARPAGEARGGAGGGAGAGDLVVNDLCEEVQASTQGASSPVRAITSPNIRNYNSGGSILFIYPTEQGAGYTDRTSIKVTCSTTDPTGMEARPLLQSGRLVGVRVSRVGSGCVGTPAATAVDPGGGSGAVLVAGNTPSLPSQRRLTVRMAKDTPLQRDGATITGSISGRTLKVSSVASGTLAVGQTLSGPGVAPHTAIVAGEGSSWTLNIPQTLDRTRLTASPLPTCDSAATGAEITVSGPSSGRWDARCTGSAWESRGGSRAPR